jgi:hypothetical protein
MCINPEKPVRGYAGNLSCRVLHKEPESVTSFLFPRLFYFVSFSSQKVLIADVKSWPYFSNLISPTPLMFLKLCNPQGFVCAISLRLLSGKMT